MPESIAKIEVVASDKWSKYDGDNGEQKVDAWTVVNLKVDHRFSNGYGLAVGVNNVLDETYAVSNTYKDLILIDDASNDEIMLMNEPGRYFYVNASYTF